MVSHLEKDNISSALPVIFVRLDSGSHDVTTGFIRLAGIYLVDGLTDIPGHAPVWQQKTKAPFGVTLSFTHCVAYLLACVVHCCFLDQ